MPQAAITVVITDGSLRVKRSSVTMPQAAITVVINNISDKTRHIILLLQCRKQQSQ